MQNDQPPIRPTEIKISESSDWQLFENVARALEQELRGTWIEKVDGIDQRYWDLAVEGRVITLHLEHFLGISVLLPPPDQDLMTPDRLQTAVRQSLRAYLVEHRRQTSRALTELETWFYDVLDEVSQLMLMAYTNAGTIDANHPLAQAGLEQGASIVLDYLEHNEAGIAFEHLLYMINEPPLNISPECRTTLNRIAKTLSYPLRP
ncbi:DUF3630 family protein [Pseudomonas fluorescens]|uniref:DUF3630 family protein n=1 Tax=Pseudomonas TaxID=286 RepID=UPI003D0741BC